jgi:hypothetical protein
LEDIMKFDKAKPLKKMMWTKNEQAESWNIQDILRRKEIMLDKIKKG